MSPPADISDDRPSMLVLARPFDLSDAPFDGFVQRHRRMVAMLALDFRVTVLLLATEADAPSSSTIPGVLTCESIVLPTRRSDRWAVIADATRNALGIDGDGDRMLGDCLRRIAPDLVLGLGPWLGVEFRSAFRACPTIYLFEEDLTQMSEIASQSRQGKLFRALATWINARSRAQPDVVVSISRAEQRRARRRYPRSRHLWLPFTLPVEEWPPASSPSTGSRVLVAGNFSEPRNSEGLVAVLDELASRRCGDDVRIRIASDAGLHPSILPFLEGPSVDYAHPAGVLQDRYREAWAALVPALRVTGQKSTILQAWSCGCPVVCSAAAAATVDVPEAVASGIDAAGMVDQLLALRDAPDRRDRLVRAGFEALEGDFDPARQDDVLRETALTLAAK